MTEKIRPVIAGERIELEHVRKGVESGGSKSFLIDVGDSSHGSAIAHPQQIEIFGMLPVLSEQGNGVDARAVVVELALNPAVLGSVEEIPIAACAAVVSPVWY